MPQKSHRNPLFLFLQIALLTLLGGTSALYAQQYTVQIGTQLIPPYSLTLSDYYASTSERLVVLLTNTDLSKPQLNVQLRMTIEGQGVKIRTRQGAFTPTWQLQAGVPLRISTTDLAAYFEPNNIDAQEWPAALRAQGKLPEGFYKFCFEAVETGSNQLVGRSSCAMAWLSLSDPPLLNLPNKGESVSPKGGITNIIFQWTPRHMNSPNAAYSTNYEFSLYELWDNGMEPEAAIAYAPLMYQNTTSATTLLYGPAEPPLVEGKRYAWRVKAQAKQGIEQRDVFRNNGNSETGWFTYQSGCTAPLNVRVEARSQSAIFTWTAVSLTDQRYTLQYREAGKDRWYSVEVLSVTPEVRQGINNLKTETAYEYRVGTYCPFVLNQAESFTYTPMQQFETSASPVPDPNCGVLTPDIKISNRIPLATLNNGDVIMAGDFPVKLLSVQGNTLLSGAGYVMIPVMGNSKVKVSFTNVQVNSDKQLIAGFIETTYDDSLNYDVTKELIQGGTDVGKVKDGRTHTDYEVDFSIDDSSVFRYDTTSNELIIRNGNDSIAVPLHNTAAGQDGSSASTFPATIKDKDGKIYQLEQKDPNHPEEVTATYIGTATEPIPDGAVNYKQLDSDKALVRFNKGDGFYAFDQWLPQYEHILLIRDKYEKLEGGYYVPWKLLPPGKTDKVQAVIDIKDSKIDPEKVFFKTPKGTEFEKVYDAPSKTYTITLTGGDAGDAQEVYALYPAQGGGYLNLGKLSVASYTEQRYKLVVVQVNDKLADADAMAAELNRIYNPIGISWEVTSDAFNYADTSKFFAKQSGLLSAYNSQMKTFQAAYAAQRQVDPATSYLFLLRYSGAEDVKNRDAAGFMPRGKQFGYLFTTGFGSNEALYTAAAHELGHGRFQLIHTFSSTYGERLVQGTTDNLMDYTDRGQHLAKWQWDVINDPGIVVRVFESDEDAMNFTIKGLDRRFCDTNGNISFLTPAGSIVSLPYEFLKSANFVYGAIGATAIEGTTELKPSENKYFNQYGMTGTLFKFSLANKDGATTEYIFSKGAYVNQKNISESYAPHSIDYNKVDGFVYPVICGSTRAYYKFSKNKLDAYVPGSAQTKEFTELLGLFTPFSGNANPMPDINGAELKQELELTPKDNCFHCANSNTIEMLKQHCGTAEYIWVDKLAQMRAVYPNLFELFTQVAHRPATLGKSYTDERYKNEPNWELPNTIEYWYITVNEQMQGEGTKTAMYDVISWPWGKYLSEHPEVKGLYQTDKPKFFEAFFVEFGKYIESGVTTSDNFWANLNESTNSGLIASQILREDHFQLKQLPVDKKMLALRKIVSVAGNVPEYDENAFVKLLGSFAPDEYKTVLDYLSQNVGYESLFDKFDNFMGEDNLTAVLMLVSQMISSSGEYIVSDGAKERAFIDDVSLMPELESDLLHFKNFSWHFDGKNSLNIEGYGTMPYNQIVSVRIAHTFKFNGQQFPKGLVIEMPAIQAVLMNQVNDVEVGEKITWIVVDATSFALGVGEIKILFQAGRWIKKSLIIADIVGSTAGMTVQALSNDVISDEMRTKVQLASMVLSLPNAVASISKVRKVVDELDAVIDAQRTAGKASDAAKVEKVRDGLKAKVEQEGFDWDELMRYGDAGDNLSIGVASLRQRNLNSLAEAVDNLGDLKPQFFDDFADAGDDVLRALNQETDLLNVWKNIKFLKSEAKNVEFLQSIKKVKSDNVWKHIEGEVHSATFSNGGHYIGSATIITDSNGVQWVAGSKIRFKVSDVRIPAPYSYGMEIQKARRIEIFDGTNWVPKTSGGTSSFFPSSWTKDRIIEETALAFKKAKNDPSTFVRGNTYEVLSTDGLTKIRFFFGESTEIDPLVNGSINAIIKSSFPVY